MAFWIMFAVSASGVVGRYLYAQIPRKVTTAELSMKELQQLQENLSQQLAAQRLLPEADLRALLRMPDKDRVSRFPIVFALVYMMILDLVRHFRVAACDGMPSVLRSVFLLSRDSSPRGIVSWRKRSALLPRKLHC
jgi:hypothetical protein